jgi:hypothetical protein
MMFGGTHTSNTTSSHPQVIKNSHHIHTTTTSPATIASPTTYSNKGSDGMHKHKLQQQSIIASVETTSPTATQWTDGSPDLSPHSDGDHAASIVIANTDMFITEHVPLVTHVALTMLLWGTPLSIAMATNNLGVVSAITGVSICIQQYHPEYDMFSSIVSVSLMTYCICHACPYIYQQVWLLHRCWASCCLPCCI